MTRLIFALFAAATLCGCPFETPQSTALQSQTDARFTQILNESAAAQTQELKDALQAAQDSILSELRNLAAQPTPASTPAPKDCEDDLVQVQLVAAEEVTTPRGSTSARWATIDGKRIDADAFTNRWYKGRWTYPGTIDEHLEEHGVQPGELSQFSHSEKEKLHAAIHEMHRATKTPVVLKRQSAPAQPVRRSVQNCPGGVCPNPRAALPKRRIFWRWRN